MRTEPPLKITVTKGVSQFAVGDFLDIDGYRYVVVQITGPNTMLIAPMESQHQNRGR